MIHYCTDKTISAGVLIEQAIQQLVMTANESAQTKHLVIQFPHTQYYLPDQPKLELIALVSISIANEASVLIEGSIFLYTSERLRQLQALPGWSPQSTSESSKPLRNYCEHQSLPWLVMSDPWLLTPIHIPKPWGQEIWYTGIEARGQAKVVGDCGDIPLPWLLELMAGRIGLRDKCDPILLKVLDPLPDEVYGDLYFELHQEKQEVYVVTHIDQKAWPDGIGAIQLGFSPEVRECFGTDAEFKQAYLGSVQAYEQVRRQIDQQLDRKKAAAGIEADQSVTSSQLISWISDLSQQNETKDLVWKEVELRNAMNHFVKNYPLSVGDVVTIPKWVPHALQHGIRVVEFQTPVYERKILSFAQKVLTQGRWDTEAALAIVDLDFAKLQPPELLSANPDLQIERVVNFDDFEVLRIQLDGDYVFHGDVYSVLMVLQGGLVVGAGERTRNLDSGKALLLPKVEKGWFIEGSGPCIFLLALPSK